MQKIGSSLLGITFLIPTITVAQPVIDSAVFEQGQQVYQNHCAVCHQDTGNGNPPIFPALSGNSQLNNEEIVFGVIRLGANSMPPFPNLSDTEISAVITYIRNAWTNTFGGVTMTETTSVLEGFETEVSSASVWDSIFTESQAARGQNAYSSACALCHGRRLNGAPDDPDMPATPPLARARFLRTWNGKSLATLLEYTRATMPEDHPGSLSDTEYVDIMAYMLSVGGMPMGEVDLPSELESLAHIVIEQEP